MVLRHIIITLLLSGILLSLLFLSRAYRIATNDIYVAMTILRYLRSRHDWQSKLPAAFETPLDGAGAPPGAGMQARKILVVTSLHVQSKFMFFLFFFASDQRRLPWQAYLGFGRY